jgi:hypothetical protein
MNHQRGFLTLCYDLTIPVSYSNCVFIILIKSQRDETVTRVIDEVSCDCKTMGLDFDVIKMTTR